MTHARKFANLRILVGAAFLGGPQLYGRPPWRAAPQLGDQST